MIVIKILGFIEFIVIMGLFVYMYISDFIKDKFKKIKGDSNENK